jgi:hypothetical protein
MENQVILTYGIVYYPPTKPIERKFNYTGVEITTTEALHMALQELQRLHPDGDFVGTATRAEGNSYSSRIFERVVAVDDIDHKNQWWQLPVAHITQDEYTEMCESGSDMLYLLDKGASRFVGKV